MYLMQETSKCHISHYFNLVSAYELTEEKLKDLLEDIEAAKIEAKQSCKSIIVSQDSLEHIFVIHPSGRISLYACMGCFDLMEN